MPAVIAVAASVHCSRHFQYEGKLKALVPTAVPNSVCWLSCGWHSHVCQSDMQENTLPKQSVMQPQPLLGQLLCGRHKAWLSRACWLSRGCWLSKEMCRKAF